MRQQLDCQRSTESHVPGGGIAASARAVANPVPCLCLRMPQPAPRQLTHGSSAGAATAAHPGTHLRPATLPGVRPAASMAMCAHGRAPLGGAVSLLALTTTATVSLLEGAGWQQLSCMTSALCHACASTCKQPLQQMLRHRTEQLHPTLNAATAGPCRVSHSAWRFAASLLFSLSLLGLCGYLAAVLVSQQGVLCQPFRHLRCQGHQVVAL